MRGKRTSQLVAPIVLATFAAPLSAVLAAFAPEAGLDPAIDLAAPQATYLASGAAAIITCLLLLLYSYRRRAYILWWTAGWGSLAASLSCMGRGAAPTQWGAFMFGAAQLLALAPAPCSSPPPPMRISRRRACGAVTR
jgi:hypothetical protein